MQSRGSSRQPRTSSRDPSLFYSPENVSHTTPQLQWCQRKHSQNASSQPEGKDLPSFKIRCCPLDFTASSPSGSYPCARGVSAVQEGLPVPSQGCTRTQYTSAWGTKMAARSFQAGRHINAYAIPSGEVSTSSA